MRGTNLITGLIGIGAVGAALAYLLLPTSPEARAQASVQVVFDTVQQVDAFGSEDTLGFEIAGAAMTGARVSVVGNGDVEQNAGIDAAYRRCLNFAVKVLNRPEKRDLRVNCEGSNGFCSPNSTINCTLGNEGSFQ